MRTLLSFFLKKKNEQVQITSNDTSHSLLFYKEKCDRSSQWTTNSIDFDVRGFLYMANWIVLIKVQHGFLDRSEELGGF